MALPFSFRKILDVLRLTLSIDNSREVWYYIIIKNKTKEIWKEGNIMKMTYHVQYERVDRIANILATTGFGEVIHRMPARGEDCVRCMTTTGVILIMDKSEEILITAYHASYKQAAAMYCGKTPRTIYKTIQANYRKGYVL